MASVELLDIEKSFKKTKVLHPINLKIFDGEFIVLVGPSGCGKSTLLRLIAGLESETRGTITINGKSVNHLEPQHRNIAMVFQNYALYPHKNVRENIIFGLKRANAPKDLIESRLKKVSATLGLEALLNRKPAELSGGQRQRVAMGRAIIRDADIFLFDEPLSNLDAKLRNQMRTEIRRIHRQYKTTTIYVTHDQVEAMTLGERVVVMKEGKIEQKGPPMEIYLNPVNIFVATFIGAPAMNILDATLFSDHIDLSGQRLPVGERLLKIPVPKDSGKKIKLGIRPDFFMDARFSENQKKLTTLKEMPIDLIEPLGFDQELDITIGSQHLKARLDLRTKAKEGDTINLSLDMNRTHMFDAATGRSLF